MKGRSAMFTIEVHSSKPRKLSQSPGTEVHEDHCLTGQGKGPFLSKYVKGQETCAPGVLCSWLPGKDNSVCSIRTLCSTQQVVFPAAIFCL